MSAGTKAVSLAGIIAAEEREIVDLTNQQIHALQMMRAFPRLKIQGCAGSGKTMLAVAEVKRLATEESKDVLILCYNKLLAGHLKHCLENVEHATASGFHELCWNICEAVGVDPTDPGVPHAKSYWRHHLPETAFNHLDEWKTRFDAVVVDEGQDFTETWWAMIECLLKPEGRLVAFYDPNQDIFAGGTCIPMDTPPIQLTVNCRSTASINRAARSVGEVTFPCEDGPVEGEEPTIVEWKKPKDVVKEVGKKLKALIDEGELGCNEVVILSPRRLENSCLAGHENLGGFKVVEQEVGQGREVRFATLQSYKGLESDVVLMVDVDLDHKTCVPKNLYVAFSRAKHRLTVWIPEDQRARLVEMMS